MQLLKSITGTFFVEYRIKINSFKHREWYPLHRQMIFVAFVNLWTNIAIKISFSSQVRSQVPNLHIYHVNHSPERILLLTGLMFQSEFLHA